MTEGSKPLPNRQHEAFARRLAEGSKVTDAYKKAGYKAHKQNASRLALKPHVTARVAYLTGKAAERTVTTVEDIARQLDEDRDFARKQKSPSAALQATMGKAKVLGLIVDRSEQNHTGEITITKIERVIVDPDNQDR